MAVVPYFLISPNTILSILGLIHGPDKTIPTPAEDWREARVNVVIPCHNEEYTIPLCLTSLMEQTLRPNKIILIDDGSTDATVEYVRIFCEANELELELINRKASIGKTPTLKRQAREFEGDVEFILDGDTILESPNYIERTVQELYQAVGIASACGYIKPFYDRDRLQWLKKPSTQKFLAKKPDARVQVPRKFVARLRQGISNLYRDVLYRYLQRFIYLGQMVFFGSITNPIGCAVAYRQRYVKDLFDKYEPLYGDDLTNSEDIFIGFALLNKGYRNVQIRDVFAQSREPNADKLPKQIYMWSSAFVQSCYFFPYLLISPFRGLRRYAQRREAKKHAAEIAKKRKIAEPYRQQFGDDRTEHYGRPMGWVILLSLFEKLAFSLFFWLSIILGWWLVLGVTLGAESCFALLIITLISKGERLKYLGKGILITPFRYLAVLTDFFTLIHFSIEVWIYRVKQWRK